MNQSFVICTIAIVLLLAVAPVMAVRPSEDEMKVARGWVAEHFGKDESSLPYSFVYDEKPSRDLLRSWKSECTIRRLDANRTQITQTYIDSSTGLQLRCVRVEYSDYPAVEWTLWFRNTSDRNTPILEEVKSIDTQFDCADLTPGPSPEKRGEFGEFVLNVIAGDYCSPRSYEPRRLVLYPQVSKTFAPWQGYATSGEFPFYNVEMPGGGLMMAIGWPGQWSSSFRRDGRTGLQITAGQQTVRTYLKPGEEIRSPLMALVFWRGADRLRAQNIWRRWMMDHNMPRTADGKLTPPQIVSHNQAQVGMTGVSEKNSVEFIDLYARRGIQLDGWNIDAGWYECAGEWWRTGTWDADKARFPNGLKPVSDHLHSMGMRFMNWFEPERVGTLESWLGKNHPEWLTAGDRSSWLLDLGNPSAREWVLDLVDRKIGEHGIDFYRQDFNMPPLSAWQQDTPWDRQGITENLHVQGYLSWWDELRKRRPNLLLDCCAAGGRRNDLETLRRAVPIHRTDYVGEPRGHQCHHYGLSQWVPYHGAGYCLGRMSAPPPDLPHPSSPDRVDAYYFRSAMSPSLGVNLDVRRDDYDYDLLKRLVAQQKLISEFYTGDFYPLTDYSLKNDVCMAWQYDRPETGEGVVQAFRRERNLDGGVTLRLQGLDRASRYVVTDIDTGEPREITGADLMDSGLTVEMKTAPSAVILTYRQSRQNHQ